MSVSFCLREGRRTGRPLVALLLPRLASWSEGRGFTLSRRLKYSGKGQAWRQASAENTATTFQTTTVSKNGVSSKPSNLGQVSTSKSSETSKSSLTSTPKSTSQPLGALPPKPQAGLPGGGTPISQTGQSTGIPGRAVPPMPPPKKKGFDVRGFLAVAAIGVAGCAAYYWWNSEEEKWESGPVLPTGSVGEKSDEGHVVQVEVPADVEEENAASQEDQVPDGWQEVANRVEGENALKSLQDLQEKAAGRWQELSGESMLDDRKDPEQEGEGDHVESVQEVQESAIASTDEELGVAKVEEPTGKETASDLRDDHSSIASKGLEADVRVMQEGLEKIVEEVEESPSEMTNWATSGNESSTELPPPSEMEGAIDEIRDGGKSTGNGVPPSAADGPRLWGAADDEFPGAPVSEAEVTGDSRGSDDTPAEGQADAERKTPVDATIQETVKDAEEGVQGIGSIDMFALQQELAMALSEATAKKAREEKLELKVMEARAEAARHADMASRLESELDRQASAHRAAILELTARAEQRRLDDIKLLEEDMEVRLEDAKFAGEAKVSAAVAQERGEHLREVQDVFLEMQALRDAFDRKSGESRRSHVAHMLAMGAFALEDALLRGKPLEEELAAIQASVGGPGADPLIDAAINSLPAGVVRTGVVSPEQLRHQLESMRTALQQLALIPPNGGGVLTHLVAGLAPYLKVNERGNQLEGDALGPEAVLVNAELLLSNGDLPGAAAALEGGLANTKAEPIAAKWAAAARDRATAEQALTMVQAYATVLAAGLS